jgi:hypothetical protein
LYTILNAALRLSGTKGNFTQQQILSILLWLICGLLTPAGFFSGFGNRGSVSRCYGQQEPDR